MKDNTYLKAKQIKTIEQLREALGKVGGDYKDFAIALNGGAFSRKEIGLSETPTGRERFAIMNSIDGSTQWLSASQLLDGRHGNIAEAMKKGAFYQILN